jgi:hypothetical protein
LRHSASSTSEEPTVISLPNADDVRRTLQSPAISIAISPGAIALVGPKRRLCFPIHPLAAPAAR